MAATNKMLPAHEILAAQYMQKLSTKSDADRIVAAQDLYDFVSGELKENTNEVVQQFLERFDTSIKEMAASDNVVDKKGAIFAIVCLIKEERNVASTRLSRFGNYLRNMVPSHDPSVMRLTAKALGHLALASGAYTSEYVDFELKRAFEWLQSNDRNEGRRHAAVLIIKELAQATPTFFFQQVHQFFDCIFSAVKDPKPVIREEAVVALRAALVVTLQRETKQEQKEHFYKQCYEEAKRCFDEFSSTAKEEKAHSALLISNELLRIANLEGEKLRQEVEELNEEQNVSKKLSPNFSHVSASRRVFYGNRDAENVVNWLTTPTKPVNFESRTCRKQISENFAELLTYVLKCRTCKQNFNQNVLLQLLPRLAAFDKDIFVAKCLNEVVSYVIACLPKDKEKSASFMALGFIAIAVQEQIAQNLSKIFDVVRQALPSKETPKRKPIPLDPSVFTCIALLARALGAEIEPQIKSILDSVFATGLSPGLTMALKEIAAQVPSLKGDIQDGLLKQLWLIIMHRPMPSKLAPPVPIELPSLPVQVVDPSSTVLALSTLGKFSFPRHSLETFLKYIAAGYLNSDCVDVRLESVRAVSRLLLPSVQTLARAKIKQQHLPLLKLIHEVIAKLLTVGITDFENEIRLCVFQSLTEMEQFYIHLAQAEMLQLIFMALQDEQYEIRESVICLLGRLSDINPALVMPTLRRVLIQVIGELSYSGVTRNEEQSARLLAQLIASAPKFMKPYIPSTLKSLIPKLISPTTHGDVIVGVMHAVGELASVGGPELTKQRETLMPILMEFLQDSSSIEKREVALWTLGQLVGSTGYAVEPYQTYPQLLYILLRLLKTEQAHNIRRETIRVLGLIGALDPYKQKVFAGSVDLVTKSTGLALSMPDVKDSRDPRQEIIQWFHWERCTLEEFYPAFAVVNLMHIVSDSSLSQHHTAVVQAVMFIFKALGVKCLPYLEQVVPSFVKVIRLSDTNFREFLFQQLGVLISVVKAHIKPYLKDIFELIKEFWTPQTPMRNTIIMLVEAIAAALGPEFKPYAPELMPAMLRVFMVDASDSRAVTTKLLDAFKVCSSNLEEHLHLVVPPIVKLLDPSSETPTDVGRNAIETLCIFGETMNLSHYASRIIHALVRAVESTPELRASAMNLLYILVIQMGSDYLVFRPMIDATLQKHKLMQNRYYALVNKVEKEGRVNPEEDPMFKKKSAERRTKISEQMQIVDTPQRKLRCNYDLLQRSWSVSRCVSKEDWIEWLRRFSIELLKEAPFPALRSCYSVAQTYYPLAKELFNAAFISCWTELPEQLQDDLIASLQQAIGFQEGPEITQTILNLAEFMDHSEKGPLPVDPKLLGERALRTRAYAKALRYMEAEFHKEVNAPVLESLISINNKLQLPEASVGVVEYATKKQITVAIRERWYEKLHDWEKALDAYERKQEQSPFDFDLTLGRMRCLESLAEWGKLHSLTKEKWETSSTEMKQKMARLAASAAWGQGQWEAMEEYICLINRNSLEGAFFRAVQAVHQDQFHLAQQCVDKARDLIDTELTAMAAESYNRAYGTMVTVQTLSELEEAMQFKLIPDRRTMIAQMWWTRLRGCQDSVEDWQRLLQVRSLVLSPQEMRKTWIKFASLCRKNNKPTLSQKTLVVLLGVDPSKSGVLPMEKPDLAFAYCKQLRHDGNQEAALGHLKTLVETALKSQVLQRYDVAEQQELVKLKAKCFLKLGQWREATRNDNEPPLVQVMQYYRYATEWDRNWYKAWHALACSNFSAILYYKQQAVNRKSTDNGGGEAASSTVNTNLAAAIKPSTSSTFTSVDSATTKEDAEFGVQASKSAADFQKIGFTNDERINSHAVHAVQCFFRSIALCKTNSLQDTLRLLTLWFDYGQNPEVYDALIDGVKSVRIETWLQVIPQLIARIDTPRHLVSRLIMQLLMDIGKDHPQSLVCPLTVAAKSANQNRAAVANRILKHMSDHSPNLVQQASLVSDELIRVAILWHELWHEGLEEASRQYFAERNVDGMFTTLEPLHNMIEGGPTTLKEQSFTQAYLRDLKEARNWCDKYKSTGNVKELTQAWDLYYHVFRRISKQLPQLTTLELHYVSPKLLMCQNMELAVPGTYDPNRPVVRIKSIHTSLQVITSKQRPRKVCIKGSDGQDYWFLLKGHEDPRQDERVMQLFGLVNTLLLQDPKTCRRNLTIQRYSVIPLSQNSGLIGWVPNCDTLHALLRDYREKKKILLNIEHKLMQRMAPDYDHLTLMQKVEVFEHALEHTSGDDLQKILWLKSPSSEVWFDRRTSYTRSLATMSMVGYVLGLGDRHPSNLMLDRMSGKIVHIDFGDCFEVAMTREKFPEKIPFRLTRMLVNAMEVTGIEGNFRTTCEHVMAVLRENKESVMAVLEAFVYDPLINWRLLEQTVGAKKTITAAGDSSDAVLHEQDETVNAATLVDERAGRASAIVAGDEVLQSTEVGNKKALQIIQRIRDKLAGRDFSAAEMSDVATQVDLLVEQAVSHENLCQCYIGWCPFW